MEAAFGGKTACLAALIQAKAELNLQDNVRWVLMGRSILVSSSHDTMSTHVPNVSPFALPIRMYVGRWHSPDASCFCWEDCLSGGVNPGQGRRESSG